MVTIATNYQLQTTNEEKGLVGFEISKSVAGAAILLFLFTVLSWYSYTQYDQLFSVQSEIGNSTYRIQKLRGFIDEGKEGRERSSVGGGVASVVLPSSGEACRRVVQLRVGGLPPSGVTRCTSKDVDAEQTVTPSASETCYTASVGEEFFYLISGGKKYLFENPSGLPVRRTVFGDTAVYYYEKESDDHRKNKNVVVRIEQQDFIFLKYLFSFLAFLFVLYSVVHDLKQAHIKKLRGREYG